MSVVLNRGLVVWIFILSLCTLAAVRQKMLWQGVVKPEAINVYQSASTNERVTATLKQGDVVGVVLEINVMGDAWCRISRAGTSEPLGFVLCFNLEQNHIAPKQISHSEPAATPSHAQAPATSASQKLTEATAVNPAALSNKDILDMSKIGLPTEVLVAKIKSSQCNFDTSPASLQALKSAGVNDTVILAMVEAPVGQPKPSAVAEQPDVANASNPPFPTGTPADQKDAAAKLEPGAYYWTGNEWAALQPITMSGGGPKHMAKAFVPGLTPQVVWTFRDSQAPVQIQGQSPLFCVKFSPVMAGTPYAPSARDIVVVRFDRKKDHRELQTTNGGNMFTFKSGLSRDRMPDVVVSTLDVNTYLVSPKSPLQVGEYLLSTSSMGTYGYDFGLHLAR